MVVEQEAHIQQQAAFEDARGDETRVADGAEQDRVVLTDRVELGVGQKIAGLVVALGTEVELGGLHIRHQLPQHLQRFRRDLDTDAVTGMTASFMGHTLFRLDPPVA